MRRRSLLVATGLFALFACGAAGTFSVLVHHVPNYYAGAEVPAGPQRTQRSHEFLQSFTNLLSSLQKSDDQPEWRADFTEEQINSYFSEAFVTSGVEKQLLPENISLPRIVFEPGKLRIAFRYGRGFWGTVVSIDMRVWVAKDEANVVALQLVGFHAGALPISAQSLLEPMAEVGRQHGIDVSWYRHEGHPVALLRFQADQARPTLELQQVQVAQGAITVQGRFNDGAAPAAAVGPAAFLPAPTN
jgi:hypothetical protein